MHKTVKQIILYAIQMSLWETELTKGKQELNFQKDKALASIKLTLPDKILHYPRLYSQ